MSHTSDLPVAVETPFSAAFYSGFLNRMSEMHCLRTCRRRMQTWVLDLEEFANHEPNAREGLSKLGNLLGEAYIQAALHNGKIEITSRSFQRAVRKLDPDLEQAKLLHEIAQKRGRPQQESIIVVLDDLLAKLKYRPEHFSALPSRAITAKLGPLELSEPLAAYRVRVDYCGGIGAILDDRTLRIPPNCRTRPMSYREAGRHLRPDITVKSAGKWMQRRVEDEDYVCEEHSPKLHIFDKRDFPEDKWPEISPE